MHHRLLLGRFRTLALTTFALFCLSCPWLATQAAPLPGSALESLVARHLLGETPGGLSLMTRTLGRMATASDIDEFLNTARQSNPAGLRQLEARIQAYREELHAARTARNGGREKPEPKALDKAETMVLDEIARTELRLDLSSPGELRAGSIEFAGSPQTGGYGANRSKLLSETTDAEPGPMLKVPEKPGEQAPRSVQERAKRSFHEWLQDSESCLENSPASQNNKAKWRNFWQQMLISGTMTAGGTTANYGMAVLDKLDGNFAVDMFMTFLSTGVTMAWMKNHDRIQVRWVKVVSWGRGRAKIDAEVYRINPWKDTHGVPLDEAVEDRLDFNYAWNAETSWINPLMFTVLSGTECLLRQSGTPEALATAKSFARKGFWIKMGVAASTSYLYYRVRTSTTKTGH